MTFVDSNVLIDVLEDDPKWFHWSSGALADAAAFSGAIINQVVVGELAPGYATWTDLEIRLEGLGISIEPLDNDAAFLAGKRFAAYRRGAADRGSLLPDFLIAAHAMTKKVPLLTRDPRLYRRCFPELTLITPETEPNG